MPRYAIAVSPSKEKRVIHRLAWVPDHGDQCIGAGDGALVFVRAGHVVVVAGCDQQYMSDGDSLGCFASAGYRM